MSDSLLTIGRSQVQHGPNSRRVYLMKLDPSDLPDLCLRLEELARREGHGKIFAKVPADAAPPFLARGYRCEATVPGYYRGRADAQFLGLFLDPARKEDPQRERLREILALAQAKPPARSAPLPDGVTCRELADEDLAPLAALYRRVFATYPFPVHDPVYLRETRRTHVAYFGVWRDATLLAAASAEMDADAAAVELTDFATEPDWTGRGLARHLLGTLLEEVGRRGIRTAMTIARAMSPGMNSVFARAGFRFGGTLANNTGICGAIESMNVWHRPLHQESER